MVELVTNFSQAERYKNCLVRSTNNSIARHISNMQLVACTNGYSILLNKHNRGDWANNSRFYAVNDHTNLVDMTADGDIQPSGRYITFTVNTLDGRKGSRIRAHEFYRAIMLNMPLIMVTDKQSYGGMRTWQHLARYRDIEVFGWLNSKPINVDPLDPEETHATEQECSDRDAERIMQIKLVSHRKDGYHGR